MTDPFAGPGAIPTSFPTTASLRGRLVLIKPLLEETVPNNLGKPGDTQQRVTADVTVVDGLGPVPAFKNNQPTGVMFDGPEFKSMWLANEVIVGQLRDALAVGGMVLGRVDTKTPGTQPMKGNPWGIIEPTEADKQTARDFLAGRTVAAAAAPAPQPVPVYQAPQAPAAAPVPVFQAAPSVSAPAAPPAGVNPFA